MPRWTGLLVCLSFLGPWSAFAAPKQTSGTAQEEPPSQGVKKTPTREGPTAQGQEQSAQPPGAEMRVSGKLFASLKRTVTMPFQGVIIQWHARPGQRVKSGEALARFRLAPEAALQLRRRMSAPQLKDLESQIAVLDKQIEQLRVKHTELRMLSQQNMATPDSVAQMDKEIQLLQRQRSILQERLAMERGLLQEDQAVLRRMLGNAGPSGQVPDEVPLLAPINGHVIWVNPDVREGAELTPGAAVAIVAVMDPMRIRTQVHEIEAVKLKVGEQAELFLESLPAQKFSVKLVQVQWTSATPALGDPSYYDAEFEVANPDGTLKEGLKGSVLLRTSQ